MALPANCNSSTCASQVSAKHRGICPIGWHIPSDAEWDALMTAVGGSSTAGRYLKASSGWNSGGNGEDKYGFSALPGGYGYVPDYGDSYYRFTFVGGAGDWWSASDNYDTCRRRIRYDSDRAYNYERNDENEIGLFSVRCLQD